MTTACTVEYRSGRFCHAPAEPWAPFPICRRHALDLFLTMDAMTADHGRVVKAFFDEVAERRTRRHPLTQPVPDTDPVVYFLLIDGLVKIGYASDLRRRLAAYPPTAQLLATEPGDRQREAELHSRFNNHLAAGREWFTPGPDLRAYIEALPTYQAAA